MYYSKIGVGGLTNQIFSLITSILIAIYKKEQVIVVDSFLNDFSKTQYTCISNIFDVNKMNIFLKKYNILLVDKHNVSFKLHEILYGKNSYVDLTYLYTSSLFIHKHSNLNSFKGDPCVGVKKNLIINYTINGNKIKEKYDEHLNHDVIIDFNGPYLHTFRWINSIDSSMFNDILKNITYHPSFYIDSPIYTNKVNAIHLRLEDDISHWANINNMSFDNFKQCIENKYKDIITRSLDKNDTILIFSNSLNNRVLDFLKENEYNYIMNEKKSNEREKNAIFDLLSCNACNNVFIGNFNPYQLNGSTFSYYISQIISCHCKIMIDLDRIQNTEIISY